MTIINEEYKQEIKSIFGEIYDEIFKNKLTYEISENLKNEFKEYKNKHDEKLRSEISAIVENISCLKKDFIEYKKDSDEKLREDIMNEIKEDINETKKAVWISTKKILKKYLFRKKTNEVVNSVSQIVVLRWLIIFSVFLNIVTLIIVLTK